MAIVLTEDVTTRNGPSELFSLEGIGLLLLTAVFIYIFENAKPPRPFSPPPGFSDCILYSLIFTPIISLITLVVMLIIPPLQGWFFPTYCIVFCIYVWIDHYQSQKKQQARLSPVNRPPHPPSTNYLTSPITAQSAPTRGAMQGVHPIGQLLFMLVGGGLLLIASFYGTVWIFDYFDYTPKSREAVFMFLIVMGMIVFPLQFFFSRSEKNTQKQLSCPQPQHPSQYRPKPFAQRTIADHTPATQTAPQAIVKASTDDIPTLQEAGNAVPTTPVDPSTIYRSDPLVMSIAHSKPATPAEQNTPPTAVEPSPTEPVAQEVAKISSAEQVADDRPLCIRRATRTRRLPRRDRHR